MRGSLLLSGEENEMDHFDEILADLGVVAEDESFSDLKEKSRRMLNRVLQHEFRDPVEKTMMIRSVYKFFTKEVLLLKQQC